MKNKIQKDLLVDLGASLSVLVGLSAILSLPILLFPISLMKFPRWANMVIMAAIFIIFVVFVTYLIKWLLKSKRQRVIPFCIMEIGLVFILLSYYKDLLSQIKWDVGIFGIGVATIALGITVLTLLKPREPKEAAIVGDSNDVEESQNEQSNVLDANWPDKAQFYLQGMSMENSLLQSYRMIFGAIEAVLLAAWFGARWNETIELGKLLVAIFGILACVGWIIVCRDRGAEVSAWRNKVREVVKGTEAENFIWQRFAPEPGAKFFWRVMSARIWLSLLLPGILIILWSILLSSSFWVGLGVLLLLPISVLVLRKMFNINLLQL